MIDQDELARQTAGDTALQLELLTLLLGQLTDLGTEVDAIATARPGPTSIDLPAALHRVRGAALAIGARDLAVHLGQAEAELVADPASRIALQRLRAQVTAACGTLARVIAEREGPGLAKAGESR